MAREASEEEVCVAGATVEGGAGGGGKQFFALFGATDISHGGAYFGFSTLSSKHGSTNPPFSPFQGGESSSTLQGKITDKVYSSAYVPKGKKKFSNLFRLPACSGILSLFLSLPLTPHLTNRIGRPGH